MLKLEGYDVRNRDQRGGGLRAVEVSAPDAILLDLRHAARRRPLVPSALRADEQQHTPVAIVTGDYFIDDTISNELSGLGVEVYLKPLWLKTWSASPTPWSKWCSSGTPRSRVFPSRNTR